MNKIIKLALIALACFNFYSCKEPDKKEVHQIAVTENNKSDSLFTSLNINIHNTDTIIINDSVKLYYTDKTFLTANKEKNETQIHIRCIYTATDAYQLNIPLTYDSSGVIKFLKTDGMFEIRTEKDVKINDKFPAKLILNKKNITDDYRLYSFDDANRKWNYTSALSFLDDANLNSLNLIPLQLTKSMVKIEINLKEYIRGSLLTNIPDIHWVYAGPEGDELMDPSINEDFSRYQITNFEVTPSSYKKGCLDLVLSTNGKVKLKTIVAAAYDKNYYDNAMALLKNHNEKKTVVLEFNGPGLVNIDACIGEINSIVKQTPQDYKHLFVSFKLAKDNRIMLEDMHNINFFTADNKSYFRLENIPPAIYTYKNDSSISIPKTIAKEFNVIHCVDGQNNNWINSTVNYSQIFELNQFGKSPLIKLQKKEAHDWVKVFSN